MTLSFVSHDTPIDLSNCDREPIHIPGQIQVHGALIAIERDSWLITQVSSNVGIYFGREPAALLGLDFRTLLEPPEQASIARLIAHGVVERAPLHAFCGSIAGRRPFDVIVHVDGPLAIVEAELATSDVDAPDFYAFATRTVAGLQGSLTTLDYCQALTAAIRDLSGYDRVMVYRFDEDWSGHVIAESMADGAVGADGQKLASFLDLHYPASDIPSQARALFLENTVRLLADAQYTPAGLVPETNPRTRLPLDLSHAFLRGASVMYTEYLVNMGVRASLTLALSDRDGLWGLVACHHCSPRRVSYGVRVVCELLSRVASLQITDKSHHDEADYRERIPSVHAGLIEALASGENASEVLARQVAASRGFVACGGTAVVSGNDIQLEGVTPPIAHVRRIATLLASRGETVVATSRLPTLYPEAASFSRSACGLLAVQLSSRLDEYLMWFRPEFVCTVKWAGDPHKPVTVGPMGDRLTPRKSFELWAETVQGASQPWTRLEIESAQRLRTSITEVVIRSNQELERLNRTLERTNQEVDNFADAASHDLKEPLRGIYHYAEFLKRDAEENLADVDMKTLDSILRLSSRMQALINALLEYSRLGRTELRPEAVPVGPLLANAVESLALQMRERNAQLRVMGELPVLNAVPSFLEQILSNVLTNALKYNDKECVEIVVGAAAAGDAAFPDQALGASHAIYVQDNGIGIDAKQQANVFKIFKRLHTHDRYGGGTGAGLTIAKRLVERMGGRIWIESTLGEGTKIWFTLSAAGSESMTRRHADA